MREEIKTFITSRLNDIVFLQNKQSNFTKEEINDICPCMKDFFEKSKFDMSNESVSYDLWFDYFEEEELIPFLESL